MLAIFQYFVGSKHFPPLVLATHVIMFFYFIGKISASPLAWALVKIDCSLDKSNNGEMLLIRVIYIPTAK